MRPKPATKRASRGAMRQNEKSASSKLTACSGKRSSHCCFRPGCSPESISAFPRIEILFNVKGSARRSSVSAMESATRASFAMSWVCQASRLTWTWNALKPAAGRNSVIEAIGAFCLSVARCAMRSRRSKAARSAANCAGSAIEAIVVFSGTVRYELLVGLRYTRAKRRNHFISFISAISMAGIALGVAALIVVLSVMNGFQKELRTRILGVASHVQISSLDGKLLDWEKTAQAMLSAGQAVRGSVVRGILPEKEATVADIGTHMRSGSMDALKPGAFGIV